MKIRRILNEAAGLPNNLGKRNNLRGVALILSSLRRFANFCYKYRQGAPLSNDAIKALFNTINKVYNYGEYPTKHELIDIINGAQEFDDIEEALDYHGYDEYFDEDGIQSAIDEMSDQMWVCYGNNCVVTVI